MKMREKCMCLRNKNFHIELDENTGYIKSIKNPSDEYGMNWCAEDGQWGRIHVRDWKPWLYEFGESDDVKMELVSLVCEHDSSEAVYRNNSIEVVIKRYFKQNGNFVENYTLKNITDTVITVNRDNFGIETPFNDRYPDAEDCMIHRCNAHIWCGHNISWVNALRMGASECNLGLYLTKGAVDCYDQNDTGNRDIFNGCTRGRFVLDIESIFLKSGEEYQLEWELFFHKSKDDFMSVISRYDNHIGIDAVHYTVFENESIDFTVKTSSGREPQIKWGNEIIPFKKTENGFRVVFKAPHTGEYRFIITEGDVSTWVEFAVKPPFGELLEKRVRFIIENQQCLDPQSPLYGAFLVYDNDYDSMYFDYSNSDHNACRERMNIPLLLMKYLQMKDDPDVRRAVDLYISFMFREFYDRDTGEVFNTIGKNRDQLRLYNAPGVMQILCEMYFVTSDESYLDDIIRLTETYYGIGGKKCYANGLTIGKIIRAFKLAGSDEKTEKMMEYFQTHVDNIIGNGTAYPKHEVNYEQTIVTPAVNYIAEMGALRENKEYYINEAAKHIEILQRFSGMQPSFHLNEIAIRFWDDVWFGKNKLPGDTLPHHLSCLSARAYMSYGRLLRDRSWIERAEKCIRNCMCLIGDDGRGSAAYVYPYRLNDQRGEFYDPWSNDQDLVLYDALYFSEYTDSFKI